MVFIFLSLSCLSCSNRYVDWETFFTQMETYKLQDKAVKTVTSFSDQLKYAISVDLQSVNVNNNILKDKNICIFFLARKYFAEENYNKVVAVLEPLVIETKNKSGVDYQIFNHEIRILMLNAYENLYEISAVRDNCKESRKYLKSLSPILQYYYEIKYLILEAKIEISLSHSKKALSICHYGFYLLSKHIPNFRKIYFELELLNTSFHFNAGDKHFEIIENKLLQLAKKNKDIGISVVIRSDLISYYSTVKNNTKIDSILELVLLDINKVSTGQKNYFFISILAHYNQSTHNDHKYNALALLNKYKFTNGKSCIRNEFVFRLYEVFCYMNLQKFKKADSLLSPINVGDFCSQRLQNLIHFYKSTTQLALIDQQHPSTNVGKKINLLLKNRNLASILFTGEEELHLDDYYAENLDRILVILLKAYGNKVPLQYHEEVIKTLDDTRKRDWNREYFTNLQDTNYDASSALSNINERIRDGLRQCNDFLRTDSLAASFYADLYHAYQSKDSLVNELKLLKPDYMPLKSDFLGQNLINKGAQVMQIYAFRGNYWFITFDGKDMLLEKKSKMNVEKNFVDFIKSLKNEEPNSLNYLDKMIPSVIKFSNYQNLYILTDGIYSQIPFDNLKKHVYIVPTFESIIDDKLLVIPASEFTIMTFSDNETRNLKTKQEIGELYYDFEEGVEIRKLLHGKPRLYHGKETNIKSFNNAIKAQGLHISTHAYGDKRNRLNSYFYLRNEKTSQPQKVYLGNLYSYDKTPTFVCLSACETGVGSNGNGLGVFSLPRPFFTKGTQTVVKTLWDIEDQASFIFMKSFYGYWNQGMSVYKALQTAKDQLKISTTYHHPYYWAGFVLEGNPNLFLK
ncbi:MAG: CHAT domain-containing protein [Saprospiraceae bacterium]|nr:CHAT domain-containing protein [Saprospiraceae bacterium]